MIKTEPVDVSALPPEVPAALARISVSVEWRAVWPVVAFALFYHVVVAVILRASGLPVNYWPHGQFYFMAWYTIGVFLTAGYVLACQIGIDLSRQLRGEQPAPFRERVLNYFRLVISGWPLVMIFSLVHLAHVNLKPAIPSLNPVNYDAHLASIETWVFGGVLPSQWLVTHTPVWGLYVWDFVYGLFGTFLFVSMMIALHREGMRGGARLVLALSAGLFITMMISLAYPTRGPLFEHPEWFAALRDTETGELSRSLLMTVEEYAKEPGIQYALSGISAMPSFHVIAWTAALVCWRGLPRGLFAFAAVLVAANWVSTVVLGWHYALDGLAGVFIAALVSWLAARAIPKRRHAVPPVTGLHAGVTHHST